MTYPYASTLTDLFLPDGYGAFGYGGGGYGGSNELLNPQWNTNSGNFGIDPYTGLPYVEATSSPSYVGASTYNIEFDSFFAKIVPAPSANGGVQTAMLVKADAYNYVEMSVGPAGVFNAYAVSARTVALLTSPMPTYDPTAHAFWRIRNDDRLLFHFDVSPDGVTWTELGSGVPYYWDASAVTISFFAGFTDLEPPGQLAYVTNVNQPGVNLVLAASTGATAAAQGFPVVSSPNALTGRVHGAANLSGNFNVSLGIPNGGLTDFCLTANYGNPQTDPLISELRGGIGEVSWTGPASFVQGSWVRTSSTQTAPVVYRDGSYWPYAAYWSPLLTTFQPTGNNNINVMTDVQAEYTHGFANRLNVDATYYTNTCLYTPNTSGNTVVRDTAVTLTGEYSGALTYGPAPTTIGTGQTAYWELPTFNSLTPVLNSFGTYEGFLGTVYLNTARANTNWFASLVYYDSAFNILSATTYKAGTVTNMNVHPGGSIWQQGNVIVASSPSNAAYVGVVPVVIAPGSGGETVYVSGHSLVGTNQVFSEQPAAYVPARQSVVNVKADRVNYVINAGFNTATTFWTQTNVNTSGTPNPVTVAWDGTTGSPGLGSMKVSFVAPSGSFTGNMTTGQMGVATNSLYNGSAVPIVQTLQVGRTYTISALVKQGSGCPDVFMNFYDSNFQGVENVSTNSFKSSSTVNGWTQISTTFTVPPSGLPNYSFYFFVKYSDYVNQPVFYFSVDSILVEESVSPGTFFDGSFASADYQWESGGSVNNSRAYYYKDYINKLLRLENALSSVLPVGETYLLEFAQPIRLS